METVSKTPATPHADVLIHDGLSLSVVIPAYNEEGAVRETIEELREALEPAGFPYEIIVVDDGSTDNSLPKRR